MIGNLALQCFFSTTTAVLDVSENILEQLDKNNFVSAVLIKLKNAFYIVYYKIWCYGFQNQAFDLPVTTYCECQIICMSMFMVCLRVLF